MHIFRYILHICLEAQEVNIFQQNRFPTESVSEPSSQAAEAGHLGYPRNGRASWALGIAAGVPKQKVHCAEQILP